MNLAVVLCFAAGLGAACWAARVCGLAWESARGSGLVLLSAVWTGACLSSLYFAAAVLLLLAGGASSLDLLPADSAEPLHALDVVMTVGPLVLLGWGAAIKVALRSRIAQPADACLQTSRGGATSEGMVLSVMALTAALCGVFVPPLIVARDIGAYVDGDIPTPAFWAAMVTQACIVVSMVGANSGIAALGLMVCMVGAAVLGVAITAAITRISPRARAVLQPQATW